MTLGVSSNVTVPRSQDDKHWSYWVFCHGMSMPDMNTALWLAMLKHVNRQTDQRLSCTSHSTALNVHTITKVHDPYDYIKVFHP